MFFFSLINFIFIIFKLKIKFNLILFSFWWIKELYLLLNFIYEKIIKN